MAEGFLYVGDGGGGDDTANGYREIKTEGGNRLYNDNTGQNTSTDISDDDMSDRRYTKEGPSSVELFTPAWERLKLELCTEQQNIDLAFPENLEPCKLQYMFSSESTKRVLQACLSEHATVDIDKPGHVVISAKRGNNLTPSALSDEIKKAINYALEGIVCMEVNFENCDHLKSVAQQIDDSKKELLSENDVVGYLSIGKHGPTLLKLVGTKTPVNLLACAFEQMLTKLRTVMDRRLKDESVKPACEKRIQCSYLQHEALKMFKTEIPEVFFCYERDCLTVKSNISDCLDSAVKEIEKFFNCLKIYKVDFPAGALELMKREKVQKYVIEKLKVQEVCAITDTDKEIYLACLTTGQNVSFGKPLFTSTTILGDLVKRREGQTFLEKHSEEIFSREIDDKKVYLCMSEDLLFELIAQTLVLCRSLNASMIHYLSTYGKQLKTELERKYDVKIEIDSNSVRCCGNENEQCMEELENRITVSLLHFEDGTGFHKSMARGSKQKIDLILEKQRVSFEVVDDVRSARASPEGISYFMKWSLANNGGKVSVAEVDFRHASGFDVVVIPVNACLCGEDIYMNSTKEVIYVGKELQQPPKKKLGSCYFLNRMDKRTAKSHVGLVYEDVVAVLETKSQSSVSISKEQTKQACEWIFRWMLKNSCSRIAFAIPQNNQVIFGNAGIIVSTFLDASCQLNSAMTLDLLLCVKTDPVKMIQMVDKTLQTTSCTKRKTFPRIAGLFVKPTVTVNVLQRSLLDVKASCYAVSVSADMKMKKGLAEQICTRAGSELQSAVQSKCRKPLKHGGVVSFNSYDLESRGVQKLIFGHLEEWHKCKNATVIKDIIVECLLMAESLDCTSVAFPVLGTGHLAYPPRDVVAAMFDGIQKYVNRTMHGRIKDVSIAVPEDDRILYEMLRIQQGRRDADSKIEIPPFKDIAYLEAKNSEPKVWIINLEHIEMLSPAGSLQVIFDLTEGSDCRITVTTVQKMMISCDKSKIGEAFTMLVRYCEEKKITSVVISVTVGFEILSIDQVDIITQAVQRAQQKSQQYMYLRNVLVATTDFEKVAEMKLCNKKGESLIRSYVPSILLTRDEAFVWEKFLHQTANMCTNIIITGQEPGVHAAKEEMHNVFQEETIGAPNESLKKDEVSAEVNRGIVLYMSESGTLNNWMATMEELFGVKLSKSNGTVTVSGDLDHMFSFENYLDETVLKDLGDSKPSFVASDKTVLPDTNGIYRVDLQKEECYYHKSVTVHVCVGDVLRMPAQAIALFCGKQPKRMKNQLKDKLGSLTSEVEEFINNDFKENEVKVLNKGFKNKDFVLVHVPSVEKKSESYLLHAISNLYEKVSEKKIESLTLPLSTFNIWENNQAALINMKAIKSLRAHACLNEIWLVTKEEMIFKAAKAIFDEAFEKSGLEVFTQLLDKWETFNLRESVKLDLARKGIKPFNGNLTVYVTNASLLDIAADGLVCFVNSKNEVAGEEGKHIYETAGDTFRQQVGKLQHSRQDITTIRCDGGDLPCKFVLCATEQLLKHGKVDKEVTKQTIISIIKEAQNKRLNSIAVPVRGFTDVEDKTMICDGTLEGIYGAVREFPCTVLKIHLSAEDEQTRSILQRKVYLHNGTPV